MKIYEYTNPNWGIAFKRISYAFRKYLTDFSFTSNQDDSDLDIVHVVGGSELKEIKDPSKTVIVQHCYYTARPDEFNYKALWPKCPLTISFHPLNTYTDDKFNFLHIPWGADPEDFPYNKLGIARNNSKAFVTGHIAEDECIDVIAKACERTGVVLYHTGQDFKYNSKYYRYMPYMSNRAYAELLAGVGFVFGLRKIEGFEMSCVEGLFMGALPIVPTLPTYDFYDKHAMRVNLDSPSLQADIERLLWSDPDAIERPSIQEVYKTFAWSSIMSKVDMAIKDVFRK